MSSVFVLDTMKRPLTPVHPGHARRLLKAGKAVVFRRHPFTIILKTMRQQQGAVLSHQADSTSSGEAIMVRLE